MATSISILKGYATRANPAPLPQHAITHRLELASWHRLEAYWSLMPIILIHALPPPLMACIAKLHLTEWIYFLISFQPTSARGWQRILYSSHLGVARSHTDRRWSVMPPLLRMLISLVASAIHWLNKHHQLGRTMESPHISSPPAGLRLGRALDTPGQHTYTQYRLKGYKISRWYSQYSGKAAPNKCLLLP